MSGQRSVNQDTAIRHVLIRGRVQGVGYRAWTERTACERGLGGWVRNRRDGAVEAVFMGETAVVDAMVAVCRAGPAAARVDHIEQVVAEPGLLDLCRPNERFTVLPTV
jgi:acylphosphatase